MTEPAVASSDATNMQATAVLDGDEIVIDGRKWWSTGIGHPDCKIVIFMGLTDPGAARHAQHSMVLVPVLAAVSPVGGSGGWGGCGASVVAHAAVVQPETPLPLNACAW